MERKHLEGKQNGWDCTHMSAAHSPGKRHWQDPDHTEPYIQRYIENFEETHHCIISYSIIGHIYLQRTVVLLTENATVYHFHICDVHWGWNYPIYKMGVKEWILSQSIHIPSRIFQNTLVLKISGWPSFPICLLFSGKQWLFYYVRSSLVRARASKTYLSCKATENFFANPSKISIIPLYFTIFWYHQSHNYYHSFLQFTQNV